MKFTHKWNHPPEPADLRTCKRCDQKEWVATDTLCPAQLRRLVEQWRADAAVNDMVVSATYRTCADELAEALEGK